MHMGMLPIHLLYLHPCITPSSVFGSFGWTEVSTASPDNFSLIKDDLVQVQGDLRGGMSCGVSMGSEDWVAPNNTAAFM